MILQDIPTFSASRQLFYIVSSLKDLFFNKILAFL